MTMQEVQIGDKILFNRDGLTDELQLWEVIDGGVSYPAVFQIGIDLLNMEQYKDGSPTGKTLLQCGLEVGYIRLVEKVQSNAHDNLAKHLASMDHRITLTMLRHFRKLAEGTATPEDATAIEAQLEEVKKTLKYALNCCHWIKNGWDKTKK